MKNCKLCKAEFQPTSSNSKYCSKDCHEQYWLESRKRRSPEELSANFQYLPETGEFKQLKKGEWVLLSPRLSEHGYQVMSYRGRPYLGHQLAWTLMKGEYSLGDCEIDHKNGNRADNRWENLRLATSSQNKQNQKPKPGKYKGICKEGQRYSAYVKVEGKHLWLGSYYTAEEAALAYNAGAIKYYGEFAVLNEVGAIPLVQTKELLPANNTSGYLGVRYRPEARLRPYSASVRINGKVYKSGYFATKEEAALAYNKLVLEHGGKRSKLNRLPSGLTDSKALRVIPKR